MALPAHTPRTTAPVSQPPLAEQIRDALAHLDDPMHLQTHSLALAFQPEPGRGAASAARRLRQALLDAIEALRPPRDSTDPHAWRGYHILHLRHVEGKPIPAVLDRLAISRSEYYRDYRHALAALASLLRPRLALAGEPPAATAPAPPNGSEGHAIGPSPSKVGAILPVPLTRFVGRECEQTEVRRLLAAERLVTLTGPGGIGKTRLALQVASLAAPSVPDGVAWADLAPLSDPALVPQAVASAAGVREMAGRPIEATLADALRPRRLLLVLDNCEHLTAACAALAERLLTACPDLRVLTTSREALALTGETLYRVPPLALPAAEDSLVVETLTEYDAVRLFVERAAAVQPGFALTARNAAAMAEVCRRLDGIPLALELAAARLKVLTVEDLTVRLDRCFALLTQGSRTALPRQQTLRAAVDWSYDLLDERERRLFDRLSVFAGGWTLEAAEAVCVGDGVAPEDVLPLLAQLVDKSLVEADAQPDETERYRLLETLRHYARERLAARGEADAVAERHATYYLALAGAAEPHLQTGAMQAAWLHKLASEHDNLRAALRYWQERGDAERGLRMAIALHLFWYRRGQIAEGSRWLTDLLAMPRAAARTALRAMALLRLLNWRQMMGEPVDEETVVDEALAISREVGDARSAALGLVFQGGIALNRGDYDRAVLSYQECVARFRALADAPQTADKLTWLGRALAYRGDHARARACLHEGLAMQHQLGDRRGVALATEFLGELASAELDNAEARRCFEAALALYEEIGDQAGIGTVNTFLGREALTGGDCQAARRLFRAGLQVARQIGYHKRLCDAIDGLAALAAAEADSSRALRLAGAAAALREQGAPQLAPHERAWLERALLPARRTLGEADAAAAEAAGRALTLDEAVADAMDERLPLAAAAAYDSRRTVGRVASTPNANSAVTAPPMPT